MTTPPDPKPAVPVDAEMEAAMVKLAIEARLEGSNAMWNLKRKPALKARAGKDGAS